MATIAATVVSAAALGFTLGGFQHLSAYAQDQFFRQLPAVRPRDLPERLAGVHPAGPAHHREWAPAWKAGDVWLRRRNFGNGPFKTSASLFIGGNSVIGPLYFGFAAAPQGVWNLYLQLGSRVLARA
ncbi:hypothetical protein ACU4GD_40595 [Cupriavidus basilensis]